jgi:hypothetical protein
MDPRLYELLGMPPPGPPAGPEGLMGMPMGSPVPQQPPPMGPPSPLVPALNGAFSGDMAAAGPQMPGELGADFSGMSLPSLGAAGSDPYQAGGMDDNPVMRGLYALLGQDQLARAAETGDHAALDATIKLATDQYNPRTSLKPRSEVRDTAPAGDRADDGGPEPQSGIAPRPLPSRLPGRTLEMSPGWDDTVMTPSSVRLAEAVPDKGGGLPSSQEWGGLNDTNPLQIIGKILASPFNLLSHARNTLQDFVGAPQAQQRAMVEAMHKAMVATPHGGMQSQDVAEGGGVGRGSGSRGTTRMPGFLELFTTNANDKYDTLHGELIGHAMGMRERARQAKALKEDALRRKAEADLEKTENENEFFDALPPAERRRAARIKAGLDPRAVSHAPQKFTLNDFILQQVLAAPPEERANVLRSLKNPASTELTVAQQADDTRADLGKAESFYQKYADPAEGRDGYSAEQILPMLQQSGYTLGEQPNDGWFTDSPRPLVPMQAPAKPRGGGGGAAYGSPQEVRAAAKAGTISRQQAEQILRDQFGME